MNAYGIYRYGDPEQVLKLEEKPIPDLKESEVLIKVKATSINDYDWCVCTGNPFAYRLFFGLFKPRKVLSTPGMEVAGIVERLGPKVSKLKVGDEVFGDTSDHGFGSFAENMSLHEDALSVKPKEMTFEDAVTIPHAGLLALQGFDLAGEISKDSKILINGGGGGVGSFALQLAKHQGAEVWGVDTGEKLELMKSQGFDHVIDYRRNDFTQMGEKYDIILDCKTSFSPRSYLRALKEDGVYVTVGGRSGKLLSLLFARKFIHLFTKKTLNILALKTNKGVDEIAALYVSGRIKCLIDGPYPFEKLPWAVKYFGEGRHHGKVVVSINSD